MFSGGGLAWAEAAMKRGEFNVTPAPAGAHPDLTGLSCRFSEMPAERGLILSVLIVPASNDGAAFRRLIEDVVALVEKSPGAGRPVPNAGPPLRWPGPGANYEALAQRGGPLFVRRLRTYAVTLFVYTVFRLGIPMGGFVPKVYLQQVVENSISGNTTMACGWCSIACPNLPMRWSSVLPRRLRRASRVTACTGRMRR